MITSYFIHYLDTGIAAAGSQISLNCAALSWHFSWLSPSELGVEKSAKSVSGVSNKQQQVTMLSLQFVAVVTIVAVVLADDVVQVKQGRLRGHRLTSRKGREIFAFQGIPYAKPPVGELRFKAPQPPEPWSEVLDATKEGPICIQRGFFPTDITLRGQEDCLFLNVYTPKLPESNVNTEPLDVMFWIHGGGWFFGSGNTDFYGPQYLLDKDVILVTTNYRLGALGFLSTEDASCPGNNGLKDQRAALRWVQENIAAFGGNPNSVTIFGESAGGASVHHLVLSPSSEGLFHRAISESGTAINFWARAPPGSSKELSKKVASLFDCPTEPSSELISCLRKQDAYEVFKSERVNGEMSQIVFKPVVETEVGEEDEAFITEDPMQKLLKSEGQQFVPWMTGITSGEGGLFCGLLLQQKSETELEPALTSELFDKPAKPSEMKALARKIQGFYFGDELISYKSIPTVVNMFTDWWFTSGANTAVKLHSQIAAPVYYFYFDYRGTRSFSELFANPKVDYGVVHLDEILYLFPQDFSFPDRELTPQDEQMIDIMTTLWTNFARTGDPTPDNPEKDKWKPVSSPEVMEYAHIGAHGVHTKENLHKKRIEFWESLPIKNQYTTSHRDEL